MIELSPVVVIILLESLLILILLVLIVPFLSHRKKAATQNAAQSLVKKLKKNKTNRNEQLDKILTESTNLQDEQRNDFLEEIAGTEKTFYQYLLRMFFNRDTELLKKIDKQVQSISEPYCKILSNIAPVVDDDASKQAQKEIDLLKKELQKQSQQMDTAMRTMNELSVEYTQIFAGRRTELELQNSSKKMLGLFYESMQQIKKINEVKTS